MLDGRPMCFLAVTEESRSVCVVDPSAEPWIHQALPSSHPDYLSQPPAWTVKAFSSSSGQTCRFIDVCLDVCLDVHLDVHGWAKLLSSCW